MTILTETIATGEFISSVANKTRSFEQGVLAAGQDRLAGTVISRITATGLLTILAPAASDGSQTPVGILFDNVNAVANTPVTYVARDAEVKNVNITFPAGITTPQRTAALATLAGLGIVLR